MQNPIEGLPWDAYSDLQGDSVILDGRFSAADVARVLSAMNPQFADAQAEITRLRGALESARDRLSDAFLENDEVIAEALI